MEFSTTQEVTKGSTLNSQELSACFSEPLLSHFRALHARIGTAAIVAINTGCFKKSFTTLKAYINLLRGHVQCFELS
jgi:hypothetical protein